MQIKKLNEKTRTVWTDHGKFQYEIRFFSQGNPGIVDGSEIEDYARRGTRKRMAEALLHARSEKKLSTEHVRPCA